MSWTLLNHNTPITPSGFEAQVKSNPLDAAIKSMSPYYYTKFDEPADTDKSGGDGSFFSPSTTGSAVDHGIEGTELPAGVLSSDISYFDLGYPALVPDGGSSIRINEDASLLLLAYGGVSLEESFNTTFLMVFETDTFAPAGQSFVNIAETIGSGWDASGVPYVRSGGSFTAENQGATYPFSDHMPYVAGETQMAILDLSLNNDLTFNASMYTQDGLVGTIRNIERDLANLGEEFFSGGDNLPIVLWYGILDQFKGSSVDYVAVLPHKEFRAEVILDAWTEVYGNVQADPPEPEVQEVPEPEGLQFLCHFDEITDRLPIRAPGRPQYLYNFTNDASNGNNLSTDVAEGRLTYDSKFGGYALVADEVRADNFDYKPITTAYWREGGDQDFFGENSFSYDIWVKAGVPTQGVCVGSNQEIYYQGSEKFRYGGMTILLSPETNGTEGRIDFSLGNSIDGSVAGESEALKISHRNLPLYVFNGYNHVHVGRQVSADRTTSEWFIHLNGRRCILPRVREYVDGSYNMYDIHQAGAWLFGSYVRPEPSDPRYVSRRTPPATFDEGQLIIGQCIYKENFTPPSAPYAYV